MNYHPGAREPTICPEASSDSSLGSSMHGNVMPLQPMSQMLSLDVRTRLLVIPVLDRTKGSRAIIGRDRQKDVRPYCRLSLCNPGSGATVLRDAPWSIVVDLVDDLIPLPLFVEADFIIEPRSRDGV